MERFSLGDLAEWFDLADSEVFACEVEGPFRRVNVSLLADMPIRVYAVDLEDGLLQPVAVGQGLLEVSFQTDRTVGLTWKADKGLKPLVRVQTFTRPQIWGDDHKDGAVSLAVIEPRGSVETEEVRRMQMLMRYNMEKRMQQMEIAMAIARGEETDAEVVEPEKPQGDDIEEEKSNG